ncbi:hypothetical protein TNCV_1076311 [Trichonephila clavipes]|uniref:Uncharacterized protein n=1 Tax=Trichonephila clavipes TaxID=2585209 RepID=A0A8X6RVL1_TRICX|nr:hypothetical protein TNCV_1076311 [Trichonephila clavipes]
MYFLLKGKKEDLLELATELGLEATVDMTKPVLKNLTKSAVYDEEDTKLMYEGIVEERKERELLEASKRRDNLEFARLCPPDVTVALACLFFQFIAYRKSLADGTCAQHAVHQDQLWQCGEAAYHPNIPLLFNAEECRSGC